MSNFDFVLDTIPHFEVHEACEKAESYLHNDPRTACFYARLAGESLVQQYLYSVMSLGKPWKSTQDGHINNPKFRAKVGNDIVSKLNVIRKVGNDAAHGNAISDRDALQVIRELHHVMIWAAFHHSPHPESVPTTEQFDASRAPRLAPLTAAEADALLAKFAEQDQLVTAQAAEIEALKKQIKEGQAATTAVFDHDLSEDETRYFLIDKLLRESGWPLDQARDREFPVNGMPNPTGEGSVDYVLWGTDGAPLAVVEAKRTSKSPQIGQEQARLYADCLEKQFGFRPVIFFTNGYEVWLWDDAAGYPPREVQGFYTRGELELLTQRRSTRKALSTLDSDPEIAGRDYQVRAIKAIGQAFDEKQRSALLVMATGTGKTRTVIALVDQLMKANWVKRVLFLADRKALVTQAVNAFKAHLPAATTVNLVTEKSTEGRVYASTYPTMMNLINDKDEGQRRFGPGYFDLIVIDEAHRSVYAKYGAIFSWFDSLLVGLTATPKDEVDHNTYRLFNLDDGMPTDAYSLDEAIGDKWLVPAKGVSVATKFLKTGIRYEDLSEEEKDEWDSLEWGDDDPPDSVDPEELNRFLFNEDTVDKVLATLMSDGRKVAGGDRLGKTIVFAKSQAHAEFIQKRFDAGWPEYAGEFARVVTHGTPYAHSLIDDFSQADKAPHIAISVDMLDTGIDVPEVVNLVFFKLVRSKTKFWQMIGRGTRLCEDLYGPGQHKDDFLVFDFCGNLEFFSQDLPVTEGSVQKSLTQRIFEHRVGLVTALDAEKAEPSLRSDTADLLHEYVAGMSFDNFLVRPHRRVVEKFAERKAWDALTDDDAEAALELSGLPSMAKDADEEAKRFDLLILRRQAAQLEGDAGTAESVREKVQNIASLLLTKTTIPAVAERAELLEAVAGDEWWVDVTLPMLELVRRRIRGLVKFVEKTKRNPVYTDFEDEIGEAKEIGLPGITPGLNIDDFQAKVGAYLKKHEQHVALQRLRRNKQLTEADLESLEEMLVGEGIPEADIEWASGESGGLGIFIRSIVGLERAAASDAFADYLDEARFTVDQVRFVKVIIDELTSNGVVDPGRLWADPYTDHAPHGPGSVFDDEHVFGIVKSLEDVRSRAVPEDAEAG